VARAWSDSLTSPVYVPEDTAWAYRSYPPDSIPNASRLFLSASYVETPPVLDGRLDDWHLARWNDLGGARSLVRGTWRGPQDLALHFALLWTREGLLLGGHLQDDELASSDSLEARHGAKQQESIILSIGATSPVVHRYWLGSSRTLRAWSDARLEGWNELRRKRQEVLDIAALGARAATTRTTPRAGRSGSIDVEMFLPWDALYPLLPGQGDTLLCNVQVEDYDGGADKLASWATRLEKDRTKQTWARLELAGGPPAGSWLVSQGTRHAEGFIEWALVPWGLTTEKGQGPDVEVRWRGAASREADKLHTRLPRGPSLLLLQPLSAATSAWPSQRRWHVEIGPRGGAPWLRSEMELATNETQIVRAVAAAESLGRETVLPTNPARPSYPAPEDLWVQLQTARAAYERLGDWRTHRLATTGILAVRAAGLEALDRLLADAELQRDLLDRGPEDPAVRPRLEARWPARSNSGLPLGELLERGYRSAVDGSIQPYALYASRGAAGASAVPLVVVLHDLDENERTLFERTSLARQVESRGWIAVCPLGRANAGFQQAGERDVLDVLERVRAQAPVDARRLYVTGSSMGGTAAWLLTLRHPRLFAAANVVSAYGDFDQLGVFDPLYAPAERDYYDAHNPVRLLRAGLATSYRIAHAERDPVVSVAQARIMDARLSELGLGHQVHLAPSAEHGAAFFERDLAAGLDFMGRKESAGDGVAEPEPFGTVGGPVADVFARGPFVFVYGTRGAADPAVPDSTRHASAPPNGRVADARAVQQLQQEWNAYFVGRARALPDTAVTPDLESTTNLVLVGDAHSNTVLARYADRLPVQYTASGFVVQWHTFGYATNGIFYATADPGFPQRTLVVFSGMADRVSSQKKSILKLGADYGVVDAQVNVVDAGHFTSAKPVEH
jgi:dienelactone hydrolase